MNLSYVFLVSHALLGARPLGGFNGYATAADPPPAIGDRRSACGMAGRQGKHSEGFGKAVAFIAAAAAFVDASVGPVCLRPGAWGLAWACGLGPAACGLGPGAWCFEPSLAFFGL